MPTSTSTTATGLPDPQNWALTFARAVGETLSGRRPPAALSTLITRDVRELLHRRPIPGQRRTHHARPMRPLCVRAQRITDVVVEASAVLLGEDGGHALAFRMEAHRDRWICTALETQRPAHAGTLVRP